MKLIKKITIASLISAICMSIISFPAFAAVDPVGGSEGQPCQKKPGLAVCEAQSGTGKGLLGNGGILTKVAQVLVYITAIVSTLLIIIGGFRYTTSNGDPGGMQSAKNTIIYAIVGLVIAIFAQAIVSFVLSKIG